MSPRLILFVAAGFACGAARLAADEFPNPLVELQEAERQQSPADARGLAELMRVARRLTLHGQARGYARKLLRLTPDNETARALLYHKKFSDRATGKAVWLDWFDAAMWQTHGMIRDERLGYVMQADRESAQAGLIRLENRGLVAVGRYDEEHAAWATAHELDCRFFHIRTTVPWVVAWYAADDLDRLALAYSGLFRNRSTAEETLCRPLIRECR